MTDENLDQFVLMSVEKDILAAITNDEVINNLAETSTEMHRLLCHDF